jgi:protein arginine kinase activator
MLCSLCKQNEATVHLTQINENKMQTIDLCEACSKAKGVDHPTSFSLASILVGLGTSSEAAEVQASTESVKCPVCGFSQADFKKVGRLGCAECYRTFAEALQGLLKSMHKGTKHVGKVPRIMRATQDIATKIQNLQKKLDEAIAAENFEEAAALRDQIKNTKKELNQIVSP